MSGARRSVDVVGPLFKEGLINRINPANSSIYIEIGVFSGRSVLGNTFNLPALIRESADLESCRLGSRVADP